MDHAEVGASHHPRRHLLSSDSAAPGANGPPPPHPSEGSRRPFLDRATQWANNSKLLIMVMVAVVGLSYFSQEYLALSSFSTEAYESETTVRQRVQESTTSLFSGLRGAGSTLLGVVGVGPSPSKKAKAAAECGSFFVTCPMDYHGVQNETLGDTYGNRPCVCERARGGPEEAVHVFNVTICKEASRMQLLVDHMQGFVDDPPNRQYDNGPDLITAQIVGPELRLVPLTNEPNSSLYRAEIGAAIPGEYTFDIMVVYTPLTEEDTAAGGMDTWPFYYVRNLVLAEEETWAPTEVSLPEVEKDKGVSRLMADGRWVKVGSAEYPDAQSEMYTSAEWKDKYIGPRCKHVGDYAWTPHVKEESSSWARFKTKEQIHQCLRNAKPADSTNNFTRIAMYGDSHSRTTLNGFLNLVFPGDDDMRAQKSFKSTTESQCFGGEEYGFEICFQWNAWVCGRGDVYPVLENFDYMTVNIGHWMMVCPTCGLDSWKGTVEPNIRSFAELSQNMTAQGKRDRLMWLQTSLMPTMNRLDHIQERDRRQLPKFLHINNYTDHLLQELDVPQIRVQGVLLPFHDCTEDAAHFHFGLTETVAKEKLLPWLCPE